jgi:two-component system sensor histidine kinase RegB
MACSIAGAAFYGVELRAGFLFAVLGALAVWNLFLPKVEHYIPTPRAFIFLQLGVDLLVLTTVLWWSGGLVNPFVSFYLFHVCLAGLLLDFWLTTGISALAVVFVLLLTQAPGLVFRGEQIVLASSPIWVGIPIGLVLLICISTAFILSFMVRLRRAQEELRRRSRMEALGTLAGGLGHELGTPLNSILVLAKELEADQPPETAKVLATIRSQAERCGRLVGLLLGYSGSSTRVDWVSVNLRQWIEEIFISVFGKERLGALDLQLDELPQAVSLPEVSLRQVLVNVFRNAEQALRNQTPRISVSCFRDFETAEFCLRIADNGPGFSAEARERAFDPFFTTKSQQEGTGLGLYISYHLLEQIGGRIQIEDAPVGAVVVVKVPEQNP